MQSQGKNMGVKFVFWTVIAVMILGSVVSISAFSFASPEQQVGNNTHMGTQEKEAQGMEGVVKKMDLGEQTLYYLDTAGTVMTFLVSGDPKINLDKYEDKNVVVQGFASGADDENSAPILTVTNIELVK